MNNPRSLIWFISILLYFSFGLDLCFKIYINLKPDNNDEI